MDKRNLLQKIMKDPELKENWDNIDVESIDENNVHLVDPNNKQLKLLRMLLDDTISTNQQINNHLNAL